MSEIKHPITRLLKRKTAEDLLEAYRQAAGGDVSFCITASGCVLFGQMSDGYVEKADYPLCINGGECAHLKVLSRHGSEGDEGLGRALAFTLQTLTDSENAKRAVTSETLTAYRELSLLQRVTAKLSSELKSTEIGRILLDESGFSFDDHEAGAVFHYGEDSKSYNLLACRGADSLQIFTACLADHQCGIFKQLDTVQIVNNFDLAVKVKNTPVRFKSVIIVPLIDNHVYLGFLIHAARQGDAYVSADKKRMEIIRSVAAASLHTALIFEEQKVLFNSFLNAIATAIDAKSPYTAGHCKRVPWVARELLLAANECTKGNFADFTVTEEEIEEMDVAALLHDCGKISTPEWVMDKSKKLEGVVDGIEMVKLKMEIYRQNLLLKEYGHRFEDGRSWMRAGVKIKQADEFLEFLGRLNFGGESLNEDIINKLNAISSIEISDVYGNVSPLLNPDEVEKLSIKRGTLTAAERKIIEEHVNKTVVMLGEIKFPKNMSDVTRIAGMHHEKLDGSGYPYKKSDSEICIKARIIAIADIFEALTAEDRPYKKAGTLSRALEIMSSMVRENHIDGDLYHLLIEKGIHKKYAHRFLPDYLIDI
jgi:HD-GYP domain-containing protein (c-di-GMP phosphodiesterase class II)